MTPKATGLAVTLLALGLAACDSSGSRSQAAPGSAASAVAFRDVTAEVGLGEFRHFAGVTGRYNFPEITGPGVALFDYDGDGALDILITQGTFFDSKETAKDALVPVPQKHWPGCRLFRNELVRTGKLSFTDVTDEVGLHCVGHAQGVAIGDIDNDGFPDVYVTGFGRNWLFHNEGGKRFTDITKSSGTDDPRWSTSASFCDYKKDGRLDLFVLAYATWTLENNRTCFGPAGRRDYCGPEVFRPLPGRLFRNDGNGKFTDVSRAAGVTAAFGPGLGIVCADFNNDGWPDFYVANDGMANQLWINRGNGTFQDQAVLAGAAFDSQGKPEHGMGVDAADFQGNGREDLIVTNLIGEGVAVYLNDGTANFRDGRDQVGLGGPTRGYTQWATRWFDYDNSGNLSLFIVNGAVKMETSQMERSKFPYEQVNFKLYRNPGNGRYEDVSASAGPVFQLMGVGRGAAFGDLNNDGAIDIVVTNNNGPVRVLLNEAGKRNHWLMVKLQGVTSNRDGAGAQVAVLRPGKPPAWRRAHSDGSYFSASDIRVHFGLGRETALDGVAVVWPSGRSEVWRDVKADSIVTLREGTGQPWRNERASGGVNGRLARGDVFSVCASLSSWWRAATSAIRAGCLPWTPRRSRPTTAGSGSWADSSTTRPAGSSRSWPPDIPIG